MSRFVMEPRIGMTGKIFENENVFIDVKCGKIHVILNLIGSTFSQDQSNFV